MKTLVCAVALVAGCNALDGHENRSLAELGAVTAEVHADLGAPWGTSTDDSHPGVSLSLDYTAAGCLSLLEDAVGSLDGHHAELSDIGYFDDGEGWDHNDEPHCVKPAFYFERLPAPRDVSRVIVVDDSAQLTIDVQRLLVNPTITMTELVRGTTAIAVVDDPRPISMVRVWFQSSYGETPPVYWPVDATFAGNEIRFPVPSTARGSGTLGINITYKDHDLTCTGFASCDVTVQAGASFMRTFQ
jgi:hypothetical protein